MALGFREIYELSVPQYLMLSIVSPIAAFMVVAQMPPNLELLPLLVSLSLVVLGFNTSNMIFDSELDALNKPKRPIPSGRTSKREAAFLATAFYLSGALFSTTVAIEFTILILLFIFISLAYSAPPLRLRNYWWGSSLVGAILYGVIPFVSIEIFAGKIFSEPIFLLFFVGLIVVISNTKDGEDLVGERKMKISSIPILLGQEVTAHLIIFCNFFLLFLMGVFSLKGIIPSHYVNATLLSFVIFLLASIAFMGDVTKIRVRNYLAEKVRRNEFNDTLQSDAVTISVLYVILVQLIFGVFSLGLF